MSDTKAPALPRGFYLDQSSELSPEQRDKLAEVYAATFNAAKYDPEPWTQESARKQIDKELATEGVWFRVVRTDAGEFAGYICLVPPQNYGRAKDLEKVRVPVEGTVHLADIFVALAYQGQGVGLAMVNEASSKALAAGQRRMAIRVDSKAHRVQQFALKTGARHAGDVETTSTTQGNPSTRRIYVLEFGS